MPFLNSCLSFIILFMNKKYISAAALSLFLLVITAGNTQAQTSMVNVATSSAPFLQIPPDARSGAMGDVGIALSPDANTTFWNNSKAAFATAKAGIAANYIPWLSDLTDNVFLASIGGYYKLDETSAITGGVRYFNMGDINLTNDGTTVLGSERPRQFSIEGGYSLKVSRRFGVGVSLRYINSKLMEGMYAGKAYSSGNAIAGDVSAYYNAVDSNGAGFSAGLTLSNIGSKMNYTHGAGNKYFLPANIGIGATYTWVLNVDNKLTLSADGNHLSVPVLDSANESDYFDKSVISGVGSSFSNKAWTAAIGGEYGYNNQFFARAGYHWETEYAGDSKFVTAGVGLKLSDVNINVSYLFQTGSGVSRNPLSNTLRFGVLFDLGSKNK